MSLSLRQRLLLRVVFAVAVVQILSGALLNKFVSDGLRDRLDELLLDRATSLIGEVESRPEGIVTDLKEFDRTNRPDSDGVEFVQVLGPSGTVYFQSASRRGEVLAAPSPPAGRAEYSTVALEDGQKLRCVHLGFHPELDDAGQGADPDTIRHDPHTTLTLTVARETTRLDRDLASFRLLVFAAAAATMLILIATLLFLIRATLSPVETLAARIARLDPVHPDRIRLDARIPADFQPIVTRLDDLLGKVRHALEREQTFTADFAHEMRTPIAGLRSTLEVGLTRERDPAAYRTILGECLDIAKGLQTLTETMLTLRRLESGSAQPRAERCLVGELVTGVTNTLLEAAGARDMAIDVQIAPALVLQTDRPLLELAIRNLLENAVAHGRPGGGITIRGTGSGSGVQLEFRNPGGPATQEEALALRNRFGRGDPSRGASASHFGLGLALVDAIADVLGFQVDIRVPTAGEFAVRLSFPADPHDSGVR